MGESREPQAGDNNARVVRRAEQGRLVYYRSSADAAYWDEHWRSRVHAGMYSAADRGSLDFFTDVFLRRLPQTGRIIEAGCGLGQYVVALRARGYDCEGVEWSVDTVEAIRRIRPECPIRSGDVTKLDVPDGHYQAYISLGVMEHRREGPDVFLAEAHRVLDQDGVLLVSVPHFHALRRLKGRLGLFRGPVEGLQFYQQAFDPREMTAILRDNGFVVEQRLGYDPGKGLKDELAPLRPLLRHPRLGTRLGRFLSKRKWLSSWVGHMMLYVCRKRCA